MKLFLFCFFLLLLQHCPTAGNNHFIYAQTLQVPRFPDSTWCVRIWNLSWNNPFFFLHFSSDWRWDWSHRGGEVNREKETLCAWKWHWKKPLALPGPGGHGQGDWCWAHLHRCRFQWVTQESSPLSNLHPSPSLSSQFSSCPLPAHCFEGDRSQWELERLSSGAWKIGQGGRGQTAGGQD